MHVQISVKIISSSFHLLFISHKIVKIKKKLLGKLQLSVSDCDIQVTYQLPNQFPKRETDGRS